MKNMIKTLRLRRGWTQEELATRLGTSSQHASRLEKGQRPLGGWIERLADIFGVRPGEIVDDLSDLSRIDPRPREFAKNAREVRFLKAWRTLDDREQEVFLAALEGMAASASERKNGRRGRS